MTFGEKLYDLRKGQGMSQEELAGRLNVSRQSVSKWELGEAMPETENLVALSELFGVSLDWLLKDAPEGDLPTAPGAAAPEKPPLPLLLRKMPRGTRNVLLIGLAAITVFLIVVTFIQGGSTVTFTLMLACLLWLWALIIWGVRAFLRYLLQRL